MRSARPPRGPPASPRARSCSASPSGRRPARGRRARPAGAGSARGRARGPRARPGPGSPRGRGSVLDGEPRVVLRLALGLHPGERQVRAAIRHVVGRARRRVAPVPARLRGERRRHLGQADARAVIAVRVDRGHEGGEHRAEAGRLDRDHATRPRGAVVHPHRLVAHERETRARDRGPAGLLRRGERAVGDARVQARRRLDALGDPLVEGVDERADCGAEVVGVRGVEPVVAVRSALGGGRVPGPCWAEAIK